MNTSRLLTPFVFTFGIGLASAFGQNPPPAPPASAPVPAAPSATPAPTPPPAPADPLAELKKEKERLTLENGIAEEKLRQQLAELNQERGRLAAEVALAQERARKTALDQQAEIDRLKQATELVNQRLASAQAERNATVAADLAALKQKTQRLQAENELYTAENNARLQAVQLSTQENQLKLQQSQVALQAIQTERTRLEFEIAKLNSQLDLRDKRDRLRNLVEHEIVYTSTPFKDGVLTISDRRIPLNGVITQRTADYIQERIDYFNNQSTEYPIFIVIDSSPGGSVMAGYKILKAMEGSAAPVYTVVKSYAASMAAGITTLARQSYAYPNAILLHHQILSFSFGNLTEQREGLKELEEWWRRLAAPIAKKMGISLDEFIKQMYANRSTGDWLAFGDKAHDLHWVDQIVETIREQSLDRNPDSVAANNTWKAETEQIDGTGRAYQLLPRISPVDRYYLHNPDGYYRLPR